MKSWIKYTTLAIMASIASATHAGIAFTKDDLVGKWICHFDDPQLEFYSKTVIKTDADGTQSEESIIRTGKPDDEYYQIEKLTGLSHWRLDGNIATLYDITLFDYEVDMPNYQPDGISRETFIKLLSLVQRDDIERDMSGDFQSVIEFIDKDTYTWTPIDEEPSSEGQSYCQRLSD